jgi:hypothetical protein
MWMNMKFDKKGINSVICKFYFFRTSKETTTYVVKKSNFEKFYRTKFPHQYFDVMMQCHIEEQIMLRSKSSKIT